MRPRVLQVVLGGVDVTHGAIGLTLDHALGQGMGEITSNV